MWQFVALGGTIDNDGKPPIGGSCYLMHNEKLGIVVDAGFYPQSQKAFAQKENEKVGPTIQYKMIGNRRLPIIPELRRLSDADFVPEGSEYNLPNFSALKNLEEFVVIVTHGHGDHSGAVPRLKRMFPRAKIVMTRPTYEISQWGWHDYLRIMRRRKQSPIYGRADLQELGRDIVVVSDTAALNVGEAAIRLFPAGHILGAVSVLVRTPEVSVFFSGDISFQDQRTVGGAPALDPSVTGDIDYLVSESTYGGKAAGKSREAAEREFVGILESCLGLGGKALLPALSIGRSTEIVSILDCYGVTRKWPVWIDGSARQLTDIYVGYDKLPPSVKENYIEYKSERDDIIASPGPCVMIAPAGMMAGGWAQTYVMAWAGDEKNLIVLSCYQDRFTPGFRLLHTPRGGRMQLNGENMTVNARVEQVSLSSHANGDELVEMVQRMNPRRGTFLVHGEEAKMDAFRAALPHGLTVKTFTNHAYDL